MIILFTDTDTDITPSLAKEYGYNLISMPYSIEEKEIYPYVDFEEFDYKSFYNLLRSGVLPKTSAISPVAYMEYFEPYLKEGHDILYVHFSAAMSGTFSALYIAEEELKEKYPDRKIYKIDTKGISILSYIIVKKISLLHKQGKTIEEILEWAEKEVDKFAIYFYVDDLKFFQRSGRVSGFSAFMGNILGIHPIIHVSNEGKMEAISKGKGKIGTLKKILTYIDEIQEDIKDHQVVIAHTDAEDIAIILSNMLKEKYGEDLDIEIVVVNPTIGSHCGPDCVGVTFHATHRK